MRTSSLALVLDSATDYLFIGLYDGVSTLDEYYQKGKKNHSVRLMDEVSSMFERHDLKPADLSRIVVGIGPGSYTGVRIGVVVAKMMAWAKGIPLFTVSSLALKATAKEGTVLSWIDARRGHAFLGLYEVTKTTIAALEDEHYTHLNEYKASLPETTLEVEDAKPDVRKLLNSDLLIPVENIHHVAPVYLRETEAERNLKTQGAK
ncbi:MAG: tRNA (adenosine(37)-N6)-threonylcarbamoyltransferase complex dimerization subunit type 1 TsaB [Candidatus Izemoplasmataceae bacterium]